MRGCHLGYDGIRGVTPLYVALVGESERQGRVAGIGFVMTTMPCELFVFLILVPSTSCMMC